MGNYTGNNRLASTSYAVQLKNAGFITSINPCLNLVKDINLSILKV